MSGDWAPAGESGLLGEANAENGMDERRRHEDLERVLETLERERTAAADVSSALIASEHRVADLEKRLRSAEEEAAQVEQIRAQLAAQSELAEQYRIEAAETQTMFDAMQHRIDSLSGQLAELQGAAAPASATDGVEQSAEMEELRVVTESARAEVARLAKQLSERESALAATRRARDQWLERLEQSGRERERLRERLAAREKQFAAVADATTIAEEAQRRVVELEAALAEARQREQRHEQEWAAQSARADAEGKRLRADFERSKEAWAQADAEGKRLRAELKQTEEVWARAEAERDALAEELAEMRAAAPAVDLSAEVERLREDWTRAETQREGLESEAAEMRAQLERVESALVEQAGAREDVERELAEVRTRSEAIERELTEAHAHRAAAERELAATREHGEAIERELADAREHGAAAERELAEARERSAAAERELAERTEAAANARVEDLSGELNEVRAELEKTRCDRDEEQARRGALEERLAEVQSLCEQAEARAADVEGRLGELQRGAQSQAEEVATASSELARAQEELTREREGAESLRERLQQAEEEMCAARERLAAVEREHAEAAAATLAEKDATPALLEKWEAFAAQQRGAGDDQRRLGEQATGIAGEIDALGALLAEVRQQMGAEEQLLADLERGLGDLDGLRATVESERARGDSLAEAQRAASEDEQRRSEAIAAEIEGLRAALATMEGERDSLRADLEERGREEGVLRDEIARLQSASAAAGESDVVTLQRQVEELEREQRDWVAAHAAQPNAVAGEAQDGELERLVDECSSLQQAVDEAMRELEGMRVERDELEARLDARGEDSPVVVEGLEDLAALISDDGAANADDSDVDLEEVAQLAASIEAESAPVAERSIYVVHFDGIPDCRADIEAGVAKVRGARYAGDAESEIPPGTRPVLAFNLATDSVNPLEIVASAERWGIDEPSAVVYCVKGDRGVFFGRVEFFPAPCDPKSCATRLLAKSDGALQRLLAVGEEVDFMSGLREELGRNRCSTAIAFDGRQAMDLIPMVKPQVVLVDLTLPRGDGLRVASQLCANPETAGMRVAMFWSKAIDPLVFRQQAIYAMRDFSLSRAELTRRFADSLYRLDETWVDAKSGKAPRRAGTPAAR